MGSAMTDFLEISGELSLPPDAVDAWLGTSSEAVGGTVATLFDELAAQEAQVAVRRAKPKVRLEGLVSDPGSAVFWPRLEAALGLVAERGGQGSVSLQSGPYRCVMEVVDGRVVTREERVGAPKSASDPKRRVPGIIEPAASGRASCRGCRKPIAGGELRFGEELVKQSRPGNPKYQWYHLRCAATALPYSFGPVLKACDREVPGRVELEALLPADALQVPEKKAEAAPTLRGKRVRVVETAKQSAGVEGEVVWYGPSKFGDGMRVGVKDDAGAMHWVAESQVRPVGS